MVRHRDVLLFALGIDKAQVNEFYALVTDELQNIRCGRHRVSLTFDVDGLGGTTMAVRGGLPAECFYTGIARVPKWAPGGAALGKGR